MDFNWNVCWKRTEKNYHSLMEEPLGKSRLDSCWLWWMIFDKTCYICILWWIQSTALLCLLSSSIHLLHTSMLKSVFSCKWWFRQGSVAIYWGIVSDSGLVKSYFVLGAWSSASSRHVKVEGWSLHAGRGPKERSNFSSLLPMTYPKWQRAVHGEIKEEREGEKVRSM